MVRHDTTSERENDGLVRILDWLGDNGAVATVGSDDSPAWRRDVQTVPRPQQPPVVGTAATSRTFLDTFLGEANCHLIV